jgi:hypothetical protein
LIDFPVVLMRVNDGTNRLKHEEEQSDIADGSAQRRLAATRAFERARDRGTPIEDDPRFLAWIDEWVAGAISMADVQQRYAQMLDARRQARRLQMPEATFMPDGTFDTEPAPDVDLPIDEAELMRMLDFPSNEEPDPEAKSPADTKDGFPPPR